jgi:hypothetical protein
VVTGSSEVLWVIPLKKVWHYTFLTTEVLPFMEITGTSIAFIRLQ